MKRVRLVASLIFTVLPIVVMVVRKVREVRSADESAHSTSQVQV